MTGLAIPQLDRFGPSGARPVPAGLAQRWGSGVYAARSAPAPWPLYALRRSAPYEAGESYARDVRLAYGLARYLSLELMGDRGGAVEAAAHARWAAALAPDDFEFETVR